MSADLERAASERAIREPGVRPEGLPRILREAEACSRPGQIGALVRREGLYSAHLSKWRQQRDAGALEALGRPRGRKPDAR